MLMWFWDWFMKKYEILGLEVWSVSRKMKFCVYLLFMDNEICKMVYNVVVKSDDIICWCSFVNDLWSNMKYKDMMHEMVIEIWYFCVYICCLLIIKFVKWYNMWLLKFNIFYMLMWFWDWFMKKYEILLWDVWNNYRNMIFCA